MESLQLSVNDTIQPGLLLDHDAPNSKPVHRGQKPSLQDTWVVTRYTAVLDGRSEFKSTGNDSVTVQAGRAVLS